MFILCEIYIKLISLEKSEAILKMITNSMSAYQNSKWWIPYGEQRSF